MSLQVHDSNCDDFVSHPNDEADLPGPLLRRSATERQDAAPVKVQRLVRPRTPQALTESGPDTFFSSFFSFVVFVFFPAFSSPNDRWRQGAGRGMEV